MSGRDEPFDPEVEELLQTYERAEAKVLREELLAMLRSQEGRAAIEQTVQKPLEAIVQSALTSAKFQEQVRDAVMNALRPEIVRAAQSAAASAMKDIRITIPDDVQARMRRDAEEAMRGTLATPPRYTERPRIDTALRNRILAGVGVVVLLALAGWGYVTLRNSKARPIASIDEPATATQDPLPTETQPTNEPQQSRLFASYTTALDQVAMPTLPKPSPAELDCVESAIANVEGSGAFSVTTLRSALNGCTATKSRPAAPSRIIAGVQAQLTEEARAATCGGLQPVTIDGRHGNETSRALTTYVGCTAPAGVPQRLETLGDYAAVGVYFIHKRMRDAG